MMLKKLLVVAAALAGSLGMSYPATAGNPNCGAARACIYDGNGFAGFLDIQRAAGGGIRNVNSNDNDRMDSWENKTASDAAWFHDSNGNGDCVEMDSDDEDDNINVFDSDELTSWKTNGGC